MRDNNFWPQHLHKRNGQVHAWNGAFPMSWRHCHWHKQDSSLGNCGAFSRICAKLHAPRFGLHWNECSLAYYYHWISRCRYWTCIWLKIIVIPDRKFCRTSGWFHVPLRGSTVSQMRAHLSCAWSLTGLGSWVRSVLDLLVRSVTEPTISHVIGCIVGSRVLQCSDWESWVALEKWGFMVLCIHGFLEEFVCEGCVGNQPFFWANSVFEAI